MKKTSIGSVIMAAILTMCMPLATQAISITLGGPLPTFREATLDSAIAGSGRIGSGNATVTDVEGYYGGDWTERGESTDGGDVGIFEVVLTSGAWGGNVAGGTWEITDSLFWTSYADGAISMHVGDGDGEPDHFVWQITPSDLTGTWSYDGTGIGGGGLSNLKLYSGGTGVPEATSTLIALGLAMLIVEGFRRKEP